VTQVVLRLSTDEVSLVCMCLDELLVNNGAGDDLWKRLGGSRDEARRILTLLSSRRLNARHTSRRL
jgi:hypothetical protein